jgi:hypothetical protein
LGGTITTEICQWSLGVVKKSLGVVDKSLKKSWELFNQVPYNNPADHIGCGAGIITISRSLFGWSHHDMMFMTEYFDCLYSPVKRHILDWINI